MDTKSKDNDLVIHNLSMDEIAMVHVVLHQVLGIYESSIRNKKQKGKS